MKRVILAAMLAGFSIAPAQAADVAPLPEAYDWSGAYLGLQAGYAWGDTSIEETDAVTGLETEPFDDFNSDGFVGGAHIGYNFQSDSLVFGIVADGEFSDISGDQDFGGSPDSSEVEIDWLASVRLRAGFAWDRMLIFGTGGLAVGGVHMTDIDDINGSDSSNETAVGYTVGGGAEFAVTEALSISAEYRFTDLGDTSNNTDIYAFPNPVNETYNNEFHAVRLGVSWHF